MVGHPWLSTLAINKGIKGEPRLLLRFKVSAEESGLEVDEPELATDYRD